ncbi:MAG: hypothetical protein CXZ00_02650 [Acidobacteria bacterium]|nr:MAG: hypothetical protein CXZ00_02650 [Acidobacteriota bacterium]
MRTPLLAHLSRWAASIFLTAPLLLAAAVAPALKQVAVLDIPGRPGFDEIALAHGMILVSHGGAGTVDLFDTQKRRVVGHIRDMSSPRGVAVDEAAHLVYIANSGARNIVVVSSTDWKVVRTIPVESSPDALFLVPSERLLYMTFPNSQSVKVLDLNADELPSHATRQVSFDGRPFAFAYDPSHRHLFLTLQDRRSVFVLDLALKTIGRFDLNASEPTGIVFSPRHDRLYVAVRYAILALDPATGRELARSAVAGGIDQILLDDPSDSLLGVAHGSVFVVPVGATLGAASELPVDVKGHTLAYDSATGFLYLPGGREGRSKLLILKLLSQQSSP